VVKDGGFGFRACPAAAGVLKAVLSNRALINSSVIDEQLFFKGLADLANRFISP